MSQILAQTTSIGEFKTKEWEEVCGENNKSRRHLGRLLTLYTRPMRSWGRDLRVERMKNPL